MGVQQASFKIPEGDNDDYFSWSVKLLIVLSMNYLVNQVSEKCKCNFINHKGGILSCFVQPTVQNTERNLPETKRSNKSSQLRSYNMEIFGIDGIDKIHDFGGF